MPEPTRPVSISAVSTGPSSLTIEALTRRPTNGRAPNWSSVMPGLQRQHRAREEAGEEHDGERAEADGVELLDDVADSRTAGVTMPRASPPASCVYSCTSRSAVLSHSVTQRRHELGAAARRPAPSSAAAQRLDPVAQRRRALEIEVGRRGRFISRSSRGDVRVELRLRCGTPSRVALERAVK